MFYFLLMLSFSEKVSFVDNAFFKMLLVCKWKCWVFFFSTLVLWYPSSRGHCHSAFSLPLQRQMTTSLKNRKYWSWNWWVKPREFLITPHTLTKLTHKDSRKVTRFPPSNSNSPLTSKSDNNESSMWVFACVYTSSSWYTALKDSQGHSGA